MSRCQEPRLKLPHSEHAAAADMADLFGGKFQHCCRDLSRAIVVRVQQNKYSAGTSRARGSQLENTPAFLHAIQELVPPNTNRIHADIISMQHLGCDPADNHGDCANFAIAFDNAYKRHEYDG